MRLLVINVGSLAGIVQMLPAFTDLERIYPQIAIDVIVDERWAEVPHWHTAVGKVFTVSIKRWRQSFLNLSLVSSEETKRLRRQLRKFNYDWVIDLQGGWLSAGFARSIHCPSAGFSSSNHKLRTSAVLYNYRHPEAKQVHRVEQVRRLFSGCLAYTQPKITVDYGIACGRFATSARGGSICLMLGCRNTGKRMPIKEARQLVEQLANAGNHVRLLWRDRSSGDYVHSVAEGTAAECLPRLKLSGIASVLSDAKAVISVDNELSHLAAALKVPMVLLLKNQPGDFKGAYGGIQTIAKSELDNWQPSVIVGKLQQFIEPDDNPHSVSASRQNSAVRTDAAFHSQL